MAITAGSSICIIILICCTIAQGLLTAKTQNRINGVSFNLKEERKSQQSVIDATSLFAGRVRDAENTIQSPLQLFCSESIGALSNEAYSDILCLLQEINQGKKYPLNRGDDYAIIFETLATSRHSSAPDLADSLLSHMMDCSETIESLAPTSYIVNIVASIWSESPRKEAGEKCCEYIDSLWSLHARKQDPMFVPLRSTYISTISALSRSRRREGAEKAEELLKDMTNLRQHYPELAPNTICVNGVLNAWSKSGILRGAATRCEQMLDIMISEYEAGRSELQPDTTSFNTVIDALARSNEDNSEYRAEALLQKMEDLASTNEALSSSCRPDQVSFNAVLNCWAQSKSRDAARRATSILKHMEQRHATKNTDMHPDGTSYTTVINAWSRSTEGNAVSRAEEVLQWAEEAERNDCFGVNLNSLAYNSMINCYAKSNLPEAAERALGILETLKFKCFEAGDREFMPDVVTYTSVIQSLAKQESLAASEKAEALLSELESAFQLSGDSRLKPNIQTYTSVVNAIGRSRREPNRVEGILKRVQTAFENGDPVLRPDVVFFNAIINAYGWSREEGKSTKCYELLTAMVDLYVSKENVYAKPDVVTFNSVLNACAFDTGSRDKREEIVSTVVNTLELFQSKAPEYGYPDHVTYAQVLLALSNHMPMNEKRVKLAKATFWQCCESGHVSVLVISKLKLALPWNQFSELLGPALKSRRGTKLRFDTGKLPPSWVRFTRLSARGKQRSSSSHKRSTKSRMPKTAR